jgi:hypothetical protein
MYNMAFKGTEPHTVHFDVTVLIISKSCFVDIYFIGVYMHCCGRFGSGIKNLKTAKL